MINEESRDMKRIAAELENSLSRLVDAHHEEADDNRAHSENESED